MILFIPLLLAGINANAQIGISRDGKLQGMRFNYHYMEFYFTELIDETEKLPKYLPKTKTITRIKYDMKYDRLEETWSIDSAHCGIITLEYNTSGQLLKIIHKFGPNSSPQIIDLEYDGNRLSSILQNRFKYNENGHLSKIVRRDHEYIFTWGSRSNIPLSIKHYDEGELVSSSSYQVSQDGLTIGNWYVMDKNGHVIKQSQEYYENKFDENENLIQRLVYEKRDIGKYYTSGKVFEYK